MLKKDALSYFHTQQKLGEAIDRAQNTISKWPEVVPLEDAVLIELATRKKRRVDLMLYPRARKILGME
jgi:hypothetical protein